MIFTVTKFRTRERLVAATTHPVVDDAPHAPVHVPPRLQQDLLLQQIVVNVEGLVAHVAVYQRALLVNCHSGNSKMIYGIASVYLKCYLTSILVMM